MMSKRRVELIASHLSQKALDFLMMNVFTKGGRSNSRTEESGKVETT
jgi:hypothetical protein